MKEVQKCCFIGETLRKFTKNEGENQKECPRLKREIRKAIETQIKNGITYFISDMEYGIGLFAAEVLVGIKAKYPHIRLEALIPFESQAVNLSDSCRERYFDTVAKADIEVMFQKHYTFDCRKRCTQAAIDNSDVVIAAWNGCMNSTKAAIRYAQNQGKNVIILPVA